MTLSSHFSLYKSAQNDQKCTLPSPSSSFPFGSRRGRRAVFLDVSLSFLLLLFFLVWSSSWSSIIVSNFACQAIFLSLSLSLSHCLSLGAQITQSQSDTDRVRAESGCQKEEALAFPSFLISFFAPSITLFEESICPRVRGAIVRAEYPRRDSFTRFSPSSFLWKVIILSSSTSLGTPLTEHSQLWLCTLSFSLARPVLSDPITVLWGWDCCTLWRRSKPAQDHEAKWCSAFRVDKRERARLMDGWMDAPSTLPPPSFLVSLLPTVCLQSLPPLLTTTTAAAIFIPDLFAAAAAVAVSRRI